MTTQFTPAQAPTTPHDADYREFERLIADRVSAARGPLFTTDASGLFEAYLAGIPGSSALENQGTAENPVAVWIHSGPRQHYNCNCCRRFIERYGGLVTIDEKGMPSSILFDEVPLGEHPFFANSIVSMNGHFQCKVTGVFLSSEGVWGTPRNTPGPGSKYEGVTWSHLHGVPDKSLIFFAPTMTAEQAMAAKLQDYIILKKSLLDFPLQAAVEAVRVLSHGDAVQRNEKFLPMAKWLLELHERLAATQRGSRGIGGRVHDNLIWLATATAPPGWPHIRTTMIGTLLEDIVLGMPFEKIKARWDAKVNPLVYQRPQAAPSENQIEVANKLFEKLGAASALLRRAATVDDVLAWEWRDERPMVECPACEDPAAVRVHVRGFRDSVSVCAKCGAPEGKRGVVPGATGGAAGLPAPSRPFAMLEKKKEVKAVELPPRKMSWSLFKETLLGQAIGIEIKVGLGQLAIGGMATVADPESRPMLRWDGLVGQARNRVSQYFWQGGSQAEHFRIAAGWQRASGICLMPERWQRPDLFPGEGQEVMFVIPWARDLRKPSGGYFPESVRQEYREVRAVLEEHARKSHLDLGQDDGRTAAGLCLAKECPVTVRVVMRDGSTEVVEIRFDI